MSPLLRIDLCGMCPTAPGPGTLKLLPTALYSVTYEDQRVSANSHNMWPPMKEKLVTEPGMYEASPRRAGALLVLVTPR